MPGIRWNMGLLFCLCLLTFSAACQYQPSSPARTEIPIFIPPTHLPGTTPPASSPTPTAMLATKTEVIITSTPIPTKLPDCPPSADPTYGFSPDSPIQVGSNQLLDGPERELIYLLTLRGPDGEEVFYTRQTPQFNQAGIIVDPYLVEYDGISEPVTLYLDLYTYATLLVPVGFTCEAPFPIQPPQE